MKLPGSVNSVLRDILALFVPILIIFCFPSIDILTRNVRYFGYDFHTIQWIIFCCLVTLTAGAAVSSLKKHHPMFECIFIFIVILGPFWLAYTFIYPYLRKELVFPAICIATLLSAWALMRNQRAKEILSTASVIFSLLLLLSLPFELFELHRTSAKHAKAFSSRFNPPSEATNHAGVASLPDVFHVVFDEFQSDMFSNVLTESYKNNFGGFIYFPNASTPYGRTQMALASMLTGAPYNYRGEPYDYIFRAWNSDQSLISQLKHRGYYSIGYLHDIYPPGSAESPFHETHFHRNFQSPGGDEGRDLVFWSMWASASLPSYLVRWFVSDHHLKQLTLKSLLSEITPYQSLMSFRRALRTEIDPEEDGGSRGGLGDNNSPKYIFSHLILPHFPLVLDEDCRYEARRLTSVEAQSECAVRMMVELIDLLKETGRFKDTLILFNADHGASYSVQAGKLHPVRKSFFSPEWSLARSRALVLVKPAGVDGSGALQTDSRLIDLFDLYPTVLQNLKLPLPDGLLGRSVLEDPTGERERFYHFYAKHSDRQKVVEGDVITRFRLTEKSIQTGEEINIER